LLRFPQLQYFQLLLQTLLFLTLSRQHCRPALRLVMLANVRWMADSGDWETDLAVRLRAGEAVGEGLLTKGRQTVTTCD
jgi:hypothetical protein